MSATYERSADVCQMLGKPGFYAVSGDGFKRTFSIVEVTGDGKLRPGGWAPDVTTKGPHERAQMAERAVRIGWGEA